MSERKVAIVGFCETTRDLAPFKDDSFEVWSCNHNWPFIPRWDRWFDVHQRGFIELHQTYREEKDPHEKFLKTGHGKPVYMVERFEDFPSSVEFPVEAIVKKFGPEYDFFTNGIAYMVALAVFEGFSEIHIYGVDMRHDSEYGAQAPSVTFWVGFARGLGIKVFIPEDSSLCKSPDGRYGYNGAVGAWAELERGAVERVREAGKYENEWTEKRDYAEAQRQSWSAVRQENEHWVRRARQRARGGKL